MSEVNTVGTIRLFSCGGAATNLTKKFIKDYRQPKGFANVEACFIDSSDSNIKGTVPPEQVYLIEGLDGSGGHRKENAEKIKDMHLDFLQRFKPEQFNIVLFSFSGGSGSVIGPLLWRELIKRGCPTIILGIESYEAFNDIENTLATIATLRNFATKAGVPAVMRTVVNDDRTTQAENDKLLLSTLTSLRALFSRQNIGLDNKDVEHWLNFPKVTSYDNTPLAAMRLYGKESKFDDNLRVISVASLSKVGDVPQLPFRPEVHFKGYMEDDVAKDIESLPLHFVVVDGVMEQHVESLERVLKEKDESDAARVKKKNVFTRQLDTDDDGMVF